jgi:hypothetical protein
MITAGVLIRPTVIFTGLAWDKNFPNTAVTVEVVEGTTVYATAVADIYRESLKTAGIGTGNYVFKIPLPAALKDGNAHQLGIRVKGSTALITGSPLSVTCSSTLYAGGFDAPDCNYVKGWALGQKRTQYRCHGRAGRRQYRLCDHLSRHLPCRLASSRFRDRQLRFQDPNTHSLERRQCAPAQYPGKGEYGFIDWLPPGVDLLFE